MILESEKNQSLSHTDGGTLEGMTFKYHCSHPLADITTAHVPQPLMFHCLYQHTVLMSPYSLVSSWLFHFYSNSIKCLNTFSIQLLLSFYKMSQYTPNKFHFILKLE